MDWTVPVKGWYRLLVLAGLWGVGVWAVPGGPAEPMGVMQVVAGLGAGVAAGLGVRVGWMR